MTNETKQRIKQEVIDLHNLFVNWFTGTFPKEYLEKKLTSRFYRKTIFITTKGESVPYDSLMTMFKNGYGKMNSDFKIVISDVELLHDIGDHFLINYTEWQTTDSNPKSSGNYSVRKTTAILSKKKPFRWIHIHETMQTKPTEIIEDWKS